MAAPLRSAFQIGWICALPVEVAAARVMLDEDFGILEEQESSDINSYILGRIGKHNIVIASLPQCGTTSATAVAVNMMRTFSKSLRVGLMVGIGGGMPSPKCDVRLGDVVVSSPNGTCGGVVQYDMGKMVDGGKLLHTGSLTGPPRALLTASINLRASAMTQDPKFLDYIEEATQKNPRTRQTFRKPDASADRLFRIDSSHPQDQETCGRCLSDWEELREERQETQPHVHYGIVASGNLVIKHAAMREQLRRETGALCFEMEAAGLMMDFPCIVIRGICDYADSHKNKQWQGYAAIVAASYAKELLQYVPVARVAEEALATETCTALITEFQEISKRMKNALQQHEYDLRETAANKLSKEQQECHRLLRTSAYEQYKNINPDRAVGTCRWILDSPLYLGWWNSNQNDLLWISADPGCGKSVLAKSLIDIDWKKSGSVSVCHFFFKDNEEQNSLSTALCAILHQLFCLYPNLLPHAVSSWQKNGIGIRQDVHELWKILMEATSNQTVLSNTVCLIDALDECQLKDRMVLVQKLERFFVTNQSPNPKRKSWIKFIVTSRPYDDIQELFRPTTRNFPHIHIRGEDENSRISKEIDLVIKLRIAEIADGLQLPPKTHRDLEEQLLGMEHRTYLWLYLALEDIRNRFRDTLDPANESIQLIPDSVNNAYARILARVSSKNKLDAKMILKIVVGARRPLTIREMAMALGLAKPTTNLRNATEAGVSTEGLDQRIRHLCGLFIFMNNSRVYLIHQTARDFLTSGEFLNGSHQTLFFTQMESQSLMAEVCVSFLNLEGIQHRLLRSFLEYCAQYWVEHVREMSLEAETKIEARLDRLYDTSSPRFNLWFPIFWVTVIGYKRQRKMDAVRFAALNGHRNVLRRLITGQQCDLTSADEDGMTVLHRAAERGDLETVYFLLEIGAGFNSTHDDYVNALHWTSDKGYIEISQFLISKGTDVNAQNRCGDSALQAASRKGHLSIVKLLLDSGADINPQNRESADALYWAAEVGHCDVVKLLIKRGANVNAQGGPYGSAIQAASKHHDVTKILLDHGAVASSRGDETYSSLVIAADQGDIQTVQFLLSITTTYELGKDWEYTRAQKVASRKGYTEIKTRLLHKQLEFYTSLDRSPLRTACFKGNWRMVEFLLDEKGVDPSVKDISWSTPLHLASENGYIEVVKLLLEKGVDPSVMDISGSTPLHAASENGYVEVVKILLEKGADTRFVESYDGWTPLHLASENGYIEVVKLLLEKGVDPSIKDINESTPLHLASENGYIEVVKLLLEKGVDPSVMDISWSTPLHAASENGYIEVVKILLEKGVNPNGMDINESTPLHLASENGYTEVVKLLLEQGINPNGMDISWSTPLHLASENGYDEVVELLLEKGVDPSVKDISLSTPLYAASRKGYLKVVELLLDKGADLSVMNMGRSTPLHVASENGHIEVVKLLLEEGADLSITNIYGSTPLDAALRKGHLEVFNLLIDKYADLIAAAEGPTLSNHSYYL